MIGVPLFFLVYAFVRSVAALRWFVVLLLLIASANGAASWIQFNSTAAQFAAWGPGYAERVLATGRFTDAGRTFATTNNLDRTRPFGLGSDSGGGGLFAALTVGALLVLTTRRVTRLWQLAFAVTMALGVVVAIVTSQGRTAVIAALIVALGYGLLTATSGKRTATLLGTAVAAVVAFAVVKAIVNTEGASALRYQGLASTKIVQTSIQARGSAVNAIPENIVKFPFGAGLGVAGPASGQAGAPAQSGLVDAESWYSFMTLEAGVPAMLLGTAFTLLLLFLAFTRVRREPDPEARALLAAILAPLLAVFALYTSAGGSTATTPVGPYLWTAAGIVAYWLVARQAELLRAAA